MHLFAGGLATETNVFSPIPTGLADFGVARPTDTAEARDRVLAGTTMRRYTAVAAERGCSFTQGSFAFAIPAGITSRAAYEQLRDTLLAELEAALPVDGVLLTLHGAMVADGYDDCETDLVERVRRLVGPGARIGVLLDLHCDIPQALVDETDVVVTYKEYPHTDIDDRAEELARLVIDAASGTIDPTTALYDCRMIGVYPTGREPMRGFVDAMTAAERRPGILSVSLGHGFPWSDSPDIGARMLVVADGDPALAEDVAAEFGREFFALRHSVSLDPPGMDEALDHALASTAHRPIVVADVADNPGGGAPSDSTFVLRELLERRVEDAAVALLWDPIAVQQAFAAGVGAAFAVRLGGKMGPASGDPLDLTVEVRGLVPELVQRWPQTGGAAEIPCGPAARLGVGGIDVVVGTVRQQVLGLEVFTAFNIEPTERRLLIVKSINHFYAAFAPIAGEVVYMSAPGALAFDFRTIPYRRVDTDRYPWADDPTATKVGGRQ